jgi:ankyrin repeat protein
MYSIEDWKKNSLIKMDKFSSKLYNKIKGLTCIIELTKDESYIKQIEDVVDTIFVDINHIDNFNKYINDNDIPISSIIKRKNKILNNKITIPTYVEDDVFIDMIIRNDGDIHAENEFVFRNASENGYLAIVECLIKYNADIHAKNNYALRWASRDGHLDVVKFLIEHGADIHDENDQAFISASDNGHIEIIEYLISHGADVHVNNNQALRHASNRGHLEVVKYLLSHGADIHSNNYLELQWASENGHLDVVECLLSHGAEGLRHSWRCS